MSDIGRRRGSLNQILVRLLPSSLHRVELDPRTISEIGRRRGSLGQNFGKTFSGLLTGWDWMLARCLKSVAGEGHLAKVLVRPLLAMEFRGSLHTISSFFFFSF